MIIVNNNKVNPEHILCTLILGFKFCVKLRLRHSRGTGHYSERHYGEGHYSERHYGEGLKDGNLQWVDTTAKANYIIYI